MNMKPHPDPHHAIINLEGGPNEVLHVRAFGKDLGIEVRIDDAQTGVVILTPSGMHRERIPGSRLVTLVADVPIVPKVTR